MIDLMIYKFYPIFMDLGMKKLVEHGDVFIQFGCLDGLV